MPKVTSKLVSTALVSAGVTSLLLALLGSSTVHAEFDQAEDPDSPFAEWGYMKDDWQLVCDNTNTCRAAGYSNDGMSSNEARAASILITMPAGAKFPTAQVQLNNWEEEDQDQIVIDQLIETDYIVELLLNDESHGIVQLSADREGLLSKEQTQQLITRARQNIQIQFKSGDQMWQVSDVGLAAVLLKLDEVQGRVGSKLALISKGANTGKYKGLIPAKSVPKIYAAYAYPISDYPQYDYKDDGTSVEKPKELKYQRLSDRYNNQWQDKMSAWVMPRLSEDDRDSCDILTSKPSWISDDQKVWNFTAIDNQHTLASHLCWRGAYNEGIGYWLIDNATPSKPKLITTSGSDYRNGEIFSAHKGRGLGDCWSMQGWVWDGKSFAKTLEQSTGMCRGIQAGGAWSLPTYISEVVQN